MTDEVTKEPSAKRVRKGEDEEEQQLTQEEMLIKEEHNIWVKNSPFLYDFIINHTLDWPSLTVQWLPGSRDEPDTGSVIRRLAIGTHTNREETNYLKILEVTLPASLVKDTTIKPTDPSDTAGTLGIYADRIRVVQELPHDGEINRLRYMPQDPSIFATMSPSEDGAGQTFVFCTSRHPAHPYDLDDFSPAPDVVLNGAVEEGYGLSWSPVNKGMLVSGCNDGKILIWDIDAKSCRDGKLSALDPMVTTSHTKSGEEISVEDVSWLPLDGNLFASVGDDSVVRFWDLRKVQKAAMIHKERHGKAECNSISFSPKKEYLYVTGGGDNNVSLWDMRKPERCLHTMEHHSAPVMQVRWSTENDNIVASLGDDRRIMMWDLSKIGDEQSADDANDGPPELLFVHSGHTSTISEFSMCPDCSWRIASVDESNALQIWQPPQNIHSPDDLSKPSSIPASDLE